MRIALIAYVCDPARGSEPGFGWQWTSHLLQRGHDVDLVSRDDADAIARTCAAAESLSPPGRLRLHVVPRPGPSRDRLPAAIRSRWGFWSDYLGWLSAVDRHADGGGFAAVDLVHHVTWGSVKGGTVAGLGQPMIFGPVGGGERVPGVLAPALGLRGRLEERGRDLLTGLSLRPRGRAAATLATSDLVLATNSVTLSAATRHGAQQVEVMLADGLPTDYLVTRPAARDLSAPLLVWAGGLLPRKAPVLALRVFRRVLDQVPSARLTMIGDGPLRDDVIRHRDRLGLRGTVNLTGRIPWAEMPHWYDRASVLLFTSVRDAFGGQCLEAWGRGLPSVGFAQFGLADHAPPLGAVTVTPSRPREAVRSLSDAVATVLDPTRHQRMAESALEAAAKHTWDAKVDRIEQIYTDLLVAESLR